MTVELWLLDASAETMTDAFFYLILILMIIPCKCSRVWYQTNIELSFSASQLRDELDRINIDRPNVDVLLLDIQRNAEELDNMISEYDVVVR